MQIANVCVCVHIVLVVIYVFALCTQKKILLAKKMN